MLAKMEELFKSEELEQSAALERLGLELRPLLWDQLEKRLPVQERAEIKRILGAGITEQNTQLQSELRAALQIYAEVQKGNEDLQAELQNLARFRLPETPARDLLKSEISFFLDTITNSSAEVAASVAQTPRDRYLLDYAKSGCLLPLFLLFVYMYRDSYHINLVCRLQFFSPRYCLVSTWNLLYFIFSAQLRSLLFLFYFWCIHLFKRAELHPFEAW